VTFQVYQETNGTTGLQTGTGGDTLVATTTTATKGSYNGFYSFSVSTLGTYYVKEVVPTGWVSTTPNPVTVVETGSDVVGRYGYSDPTNFGDAHITTGSRRARTLGFWANNGNSSIPQSDRQTLTTLYLRNADGSLFAFTHNPNGGTLTSKQLAADRTQLANWLLNATSTNMAYMLSAQLAATQLNVLHGFVNPNQYVYIPNVSGETSDDLKALKNPPSGLNAIPGNFVSIQTAIADAVLALQNHGKTPSGSPARNYEEGLMNTFNSNNNNGSIFVS
jgi:hypothetical protein